jgi:hypothetical protein
MNSSLAAVPVTARMLGTISKKSWKPRKEFQEAISKCPSTVRSQMKLGGGKYFPTH